MSGTYLLGEKKVRPGVYFRRERRGVELAGATNGVLAVLFQTNWGPLNKVVELDPTMRNNLADYFGGSVDILREGFIGGATTIRAVRVGGDDGECSKLMLKAPSTEVDGETVAGADLVEITSAYVGTRIFSASVRTNLITEERQLIIYNGVDIFEQFSFTAGGDEATALVEAVSSSKNFNARLIATGTLADITQAEIRGGKNPTVTNASYDKGTNVLERYKWNCLIADSDDPAVSGILSSFVSQSYDTGHLGFYCVAGRSSQTLEARMQLAASYNDEKGVYVLNGWTSNDGTVYDGWLAAARIGGMIAAFETNTSITHDVITNALELIEPLTNGEMIQAEQRGCLVLSQNDAGQVWVDNAINTLVTLNANMDEGWKKIRRTKCRFELIDRVNTTHESLIGNVSNNENGRQTVVAAAQRIINEMVAEDKLFFGSYVDLDPDHVSEGDYCYLRFHILDVDSLEKIYNTFIFRFGSTFDGE